MTVVAVTGLSSFLGAPGTGIIHAMRLSGDRSLKIIGMDYYAFCDGFFSSQLDGAYVIPSPKRRKEFVRRLEEITKKEKIDVMIPSLDAEVIFLSKIRGIIELLGIKTLIPEAGCVMKVRDKVSQLGFLQECEIPHPASRKADLSSDPAKLIEGMRFPVLIKCEEGAFPAFDTEELRVIARRLRKEFVVQEYVKGDEYSICLLAYPKGEIYGYVIQKKIGQSDIGATLIGVTVDREDVLETSKDFVKKLGWIGPMELEFRGKDKLYLIDINLRFPAWVTLTAAAGVNLPYAAVQLALGRRYEVGRQRTGVVIVRTVRDIHIDIFDLFKFSKWK
jgi:carbamoyl-phosphate synthase large subunit